MPTAYSTVRWFRGPVQCICQSVLVLEAGELHEICHVLRPATSTTAQSKLAWLHSCLEPILVGLWHVTCERPACHGPTKCHRITHPHSTANRGIPLLPYTLASQAVGCIMFCTGYLGCTGMGSHNLRYTRAILAFPYLAPPMLHAPLVALLGLLLDGSVGLDTLCGRCEGN